MEPMTMVFFLIGAVFVNVLTYGGVAWIYFRDKSGPTRTRGGDARARTSRAGVGGDRPPSP